MRCIFCKKDSSETKSIEHIIPESLGNKSFVLPRGYVCDKCNNYFAREIERPFLEQMNVQLLRFEESIPNKKNRIPTIKGLIEDEEVIVHKRIINNRAVTDVDISQELMNRLMKEKGETQLLLPAFNEKALPPQNNGKTPALTQRTFRLRLVTPSGVGSPNEAQGWFSVLTFGL